MKAKVFLAGVAVVLLGVAVAGIPAGAQPVPAPMPRKAGMSESTGTGDDAKAAGKAKDVKPKESAESPDASTSSAGETGGTESVSASFNGEAGEWETVGGHKPRADVATDKEATAEVRREAAARQKELNALPPIEASEFKTPETVCGPDNRTQVAATTSTPWRWNCQLLITMKNGSQFRGTGWFAGPCLVMTAGHCVYSHANGGWAKSIEVIPGMSGTSRPYGSQTSSNLRSVTGWTTSQNQEYDYGCILLPNSTLGNKVGWFGFANLSDSELNGLLVNTAGYPGDKTFGTQWFMSDKITSVTARKLYYMIDSYGGQSGSAVWRFKDGQRHAVGVHAYGGCPNSATRINGDVYNNIVAWRNLCK